jgi:hypothetical protein
VFHLTDMIEVMTVETRYAESGDVYIAYQISGLDGPDLLAAPGYVSHLEHFWEDRPSRVFTMRWERSRG